MFERTQSDVSGGEVKLDYQSLIAVAEISQGLTMQEIRRHMKELDYPSQPSPVTLRLETQWLAMAAERLALVAETLSALRTGLLRDKVLIVNRT